MVYRSVLAQALPILVLCSWLKTMHRSSRQQLRRLQSLSSKRALPCKRKQTNQTQKFLTKKKLNKFIEVVLPQGLISLHLTLGNNFWKETHINFFVNVIVESRRSQDEQRSFFVAKKFCFSSIFHYLTLSSTERVRCEDVGVATISRQPASESALPWHGQGVVCSPIEPTSGSKIVQQENFLHHGKFECLGVASSLEIHQIWHGVHVARTGCCSCSNRILLRIPKKNRNKKI